MNGSTARMHQHIALRTAAEAASFSRGSVVIITFVELMLSKSMMAMGGERGEEGGGRKGNK